VLGNRQVEPFLKRGLILNTEQQKLLQVNDLRMHFPVIDGTLLRRTVGWVKAVDGVSFSMQRGETLGLVGESGCGKTTLARCILQLYKPVSGQVMFEGINLGDISQKDLRIARQRIQIIFQDPYASLNPRLTAGAIIGEPLVIHKLSESKNALTDRVRELALMVGLHPSMLDRFPHEFSSGQRQRIGIARALALEPDLIVADEPVSALDASIQAQIINLMQYLQDRLNLSYLFIAHDLSVVRHVSDRVAVMYLGKIVELADRDEIYENPLHPYTQALLSAVPIPDPLIETKRKRIVLTGEMPSPQHPPSGCSFHTRCPVAIERCINEIPELREVLPNHWVSCLRVSDYDQN
jgi:oligopeptide transport system ATP-binding protein